MRDTISILLRDWFPNLSIPIMGSAIIIGVTLLNLLGADKLSKLESGLAALKLLALGAFIIIGLLLILGLFFRNAPVGIGEISNEPLMPGGITGIAGSMLIVVFAYAGFEIIGSVFDQFRRICFIVYLCVHTCGSYPLTKKKRMPSPG